MATLSTMIQAVSTALTTPQGINPALFATTNCFYSFNPVKSFAFPPTDLFAVIQPNDIKTKNRTFTKNLILSADVTIWLFSRLNLDLVNQEDSLLLDATYGVLVIAESVVSTLQAYSPTDGINVWGYQLDTVQFDTLEKQGVGWANVRLQYHTDVTGH